MTGSQPQPRHTPRAFSLIEILTSLTIIAILVALLLPALGNVRRENQMLVSTVNARTLTQVITLRAQANRSTFPTPEPGQLNTDPHTGISFAFPYWQITQTWPGVFGIDDTYVRSPEIFWSPGNYDPQARSSKSGRIWPPDYMLTMTVAGDPRLWGDKPVSGNPVDLRRGMRLDEIRFPSAKAAIWDPILAWQRDQPATDAHGNLQTQTPVSSFDGSVTPRVPAECAPAAPHQDPETIFTGMNLQHTPDGLHGRDW